MSSQDFSRHSAATASSDATKLGVLGKWINMRNVVMTSTARTVWVQIPRYAKIFGIGV